MKKNKKFVVMLMVLSMVMSLAAGCSKDNKTDEEKTSNTSEVAVTEAPVVDVDPLGKYDPAIDIRVTKIIDDTTKYPEGQKTDDNSWTKEYANTLGINVKYDWFANSQQGEQKMNVTIASGDLPDIFPVNATQFASLVENGSVVDLTEVYEQYASELLKKIVSQDESLINLGKVNDRLMGVPNTNGGSAVDAPAVLYIREDWRTKLNLPEPTTMQDLFTIIKAFTTQDPDGNGANDTYGLALTNNFILDGFAGGQGFFNGYHAYPGGFITDESGNIVYGGIQPQTKAALQKLSELYAAGQIDMEFGAKDVSKVAEALTNGKVGIEFGAMWNPLWPLQQNVDLDPNAEWKSYPVPSVDGDAAKVQVSVAAGEYWVVRSDYEHPEALIKMLNLWVEKCWGETADDKNLFNGTGTDYIPFKFALAQVWPALKNVNAHTNVVAAIEKGDTSTLNAEEKGYYDKVTAYLNGDRVNWSTAKVFGNGSSYDVIDKYRADNLYLYNAFTGAPTPTMVEKISTLNKMEIEVFTKIIMGTEPIDSFDQFVEDWKSLGGDDITKELNER